MLAIPREILPKQYADLIRGYCREFFVFKGMIADFAIHDKGGCQLEAVQANMKIVRDVRHWLNQMLPSEQYRQTAELGKKPSVQGEPEAELSH